MNLEPGSKIGDYEIVGQLGAGGMGRVYKVRNELSDRIEAMKVLLPDLEGQADLANRFLREIKVQANLDHPNIAKLYTASRIENRLLMFMEYVEGITLDERVKQGAIPLANAVDYVEQVLGALEYAHQRGVVHRDIKPANMMLMPDGRIKLLDFGIAKAAADNRLTMTGTTLGSLYYMAPEQIQGTGVDMRSDLYSVGVSLYEMATGAKPFDGESQFAIMSAHLARNPVPPIEVNSSVPQAVSEIILMSLSKDPASRFQTAGAFLNALRNVQLPPESASPAAAPPLAATRFASQETATIPAPPPPPHVATAPTAPIPGAALQDSVPSVNAVPLPPPPPPAADFHLIEPTGAPKKSGPKRMIWVALGGLAAALAIVAFIQFGPRIRTSAKETAIPSTPGEPPAAASSTLVATPPAQPPASEPPSSQPPSSQPPADQPPAARPPAPNHNAAPVLPPLLGKPPSTPDTRKPKTERAQAQPEAKSPPPQPAVQQPPQQPETPPPQPNRPQPTAADYALSNQANQNRMQIEELSDQYTKMIARANAVKASMDSLSAAQARQGVGMRQDWVAAYNLLVTYMESAKRALGNEDPPNARSALGKAERQLGILEQAMGR